MINADFLNQLERFSLVVKKKVTSSFVGERNTQIIGQGLIFRDHAAYVRGDDFKHIDWKVFARTDKLYVKRFEADRNLTVHVLVDYSGSMNFGRKIKKYEYAAKVGLGFVFIAMKNNENFVLSTFDHQLDLFRPRKGGKQMGEIVYYLNQRKPSGQTNFEESLISYKKLINSKSLIIIVSDFLYDPKEIRNVLYRLKRNKVIVIQVLDPIESTLNIEGDFNLVDLESDTTMRTYIDPYQRKNYLERMNKHKDELHRACDEIGATYYNVSTDEDVFDVFYRILS